MSRLLQLPELIGANSFALGSQLQTLRIKRKARGQIANTLLNLTPNLFRIWRVNDFGNQAADLAHFGFFHPARADGRCADAQAGSDERLVLIKWNSVLV